MVCHVLNGDALASSFSQSRLGGEVIVFREGLVEGDLSGKTLAEFWRARARFQGVSETDYAARVGGEFEKILHAPDNAEFNLWFEFDLFCQVNMWFVLSLIKGLSVKRKVNAVYTFHLKEEDPHFWTGFGPATADQLRFCHGHRMPLTGADVQLGSDLWMAYKHSDLGGLMRLARNQSHTFPHLMEVIQAHIDRFPSDGAKGRPERVLEEIMKGATDFQEICREFWRRESIYGFGDLQIKHIYDELFRVPPGSPPLRA